MRRLALVVLLLGACAQGGANDDDRRTKNCERLRDHSIDLRLEAAPPPAGMMPEEVERHRATFVAAAGSRYVDDCRNHWDDEQVACALSASSLDSLRACLPQPGNRGSTPCDRTKHRSMRSLP